MADASSSVLGKRFRNIIAGIVGEETIGKIEKAIKTSFEGPVDANNDQFNPSFQRKMTYPEAYCGSHATVKIMERLLLDYQEKRVSKYILVTSFPVLLTCLIGRYIDVVMTALYPDNIIVDLQGAIAILVNWFNKITIASTDQVLEIAAEMMMIASHFKQYEMPLEQDDEAVIINRYFSLKQLIYPSRFKHSGINMLVLDPIEQRQAVINKMRRIAQVMLFVGSCHAILEELLNSAPMESYIRILSMFEYAVLGTFFWHVQSSEVSEYLEENKDIVLETLLLTLPLVVNAGFSIAPVTYVRINAVVGVPERLTALGYVAVLKHPDIVLKNLLELVKSLCGNVLALAGGPVTVSTPLAVAVLAFFNARWSIHHKMKLFSVFMFTGASFYVIGGLLMSDLEEYEAQRENILGDMKGFYNPDPDVFVGTPGTDDQDINYRMAALVIAYRGKLKLVTYGGVGIYIAGRFSGEKMSVHTGMHEDLYAKPTMVSRDIYSYRNPVENTGKRLTTKRLLKFTGMVLTSMTVSYSAAVIGDTILDSFIRENAVVKEFTEVFELLAKDALDARFNTETPPFKRKETVYVKTNETNYEWQDILNAMKGENSINAKKVAETFVKASTKKTYINPALVSITRENWKTILGSAANDVSVDKLIQDLRQYKNIGYSLKAYSVYESNTYGIKCLMDAWTANPFKYKDLTSIKDALLENLRIFFQMMVDTATSVYNFSFVAYGTSIATSPSAWILASFDPLMKILIALVLWQTKTMLSWFKKAEKNDRVAPQDIIQLSKNFTLVTLNRQLYGILDVFALSSILVRYLTIGLSKDQEDYILSYIGEIESYNNNTLPALQGKSNRFYSLKPSAPIELIENG